jgi:hypothetical protein
MSRHGIFTLAAGRKKRPAPVSCGESRRLLPPPHLATWRVRPEWPHRFWTREPSFPSDR